jgi:hypothetical protein
MESFLYSRINQVSREKEAGSIKTLGPFGVALTRVLEKCQHNKKDRIVGEFTVYRGIAIP